MDHLISATFGGEKSIGERLEEVGERRRTTENDGERQGMTEKNVERT